MIGKLIVVHSGKGGVGKTIMATNICKEMPNVRYCTNDVNGISLVDENMVADPVYLKNTTMQELNEMLSRSINIVVDFAGGTIIQGFEEQIVRAANMVVIAVGRTYDEYIPAITDAVGLSEINKVILFISSGRTPLSSSDEINISELIRKHHNSKAFLSLPSSEKLVLLSNVKNIKFSQAKTLVKDLQMQDKLFLQQWEKMNEILTFV